MTRRRLVNAAARALHEDHLGQVAQGFELPTSARWNQCARCLGAADIAVAAVLDLLDDDSTLPVVNFAGQEVGRARRR